MVSRRKSIAYLSDRTGEFELYHSPQMAGTKRASPSMARLSLWSRVVSRQQKLLYWDKVLQLWYVSLDDKKPVLVDKSEYGTISDGSWSPDSL